MWVKHIAAVNVGPFEKFVTDLTRGSVGIFGRNGKGKSTLVNLMYAVVTNDFGRFDGVKSDMVRNTADAKAESYAFVEVEHGGRRLRITRNFRPTKSRPGTVVVVNDGDLPVAEETNADKAQKLIYDTLGVDQKLLDLYVFKQQDKIYDFLTSIPSERAKAYAALCRTEDCEKIWSALGEYLNKDKELNVEIVDNSDELTQAIHELTTEAAALLEQKETASAKLCEDKWLGKYRQRVKDADRFATLEEEKLELEGEIEQSKVTAKKRLTASKEKGTELNEAQAKYDKKKAKADDTRAALKAFDAYKTYRRQRKVLREEKEALDAEADKNRPPDAVDDADKLEAGKKKLTKVEGELEEAQKVVATFHTTQRAACPTCKTPVADLKDHIAAMQKKCVELPAEIKRMEDKIEAIENYLAAVRKHEKWKIGHDARSKANAKALDAVKTVEAPDGDEAALKAWLADFETAEQELSALAVAYRLTEREAEKAQGVVDQKANRLADVRQKMAEITLDADQLEKAKRRLAEHAVAENEIARVEGEAKGTGKQLEAKKEEFKKLKAKLKRGKRVRQMAKVIEQSREVLHRDRLPRRVAEMNLSRMEGDINEQLAHFGDPYWVESNAELSFVVHKPGEPPQPAGRLSTGQRVILALAFWPSVASLWSAELGMLALDEPTANLDGENRKFLREALSAMTAKVRGERQLIMVTHDPDLRSAFDQVLDLGVDMRQTQRTDLVARLHTDKAGLVWYGDDDQPYEKTGLDPWAFMEDDRFLNELNDARVIRVLGTRDNAPLIVKLHERGVGCSEFGKKPIQLGSPAAVPAAWLKGDPAAVLHHLWQPPASSDLFSHWHEMTKQDYSTYAMINTLGNKDYDEVPPVTKKIAQYHPAWPAVTFVNGADEDAACLLLCHIVDPRWYCHEWHVNRPSRLHASLGLTPTNMAAIAGNKNRTKRHFNRATVAARVWYNRWSHRPAVEPGDFLLSTLSAYPSVAKGLLRGTQRLVNFIREVWLDAVRARPAGWFDPAAFFRDAEIGAAYRQHRAKYKRV